MSDEDSWEDYESGPFCRHWGELGDCDEICACGHSCNDHGWDDSCDQRGCECKAWTEKEKAASP